MIMRKLGIDHTSELIKKAEEFRNRFVKEEEKEMKDSGEGEDDQEEEEESEGDSDGDLIGVISI